VTAPLVFTVALGSVVPVGPWQAFESAHYRLTAPAGFEHASDWLALAEAVHAELGAYFGAVPPVDGRLEVVYCPDQASYRNRLAADGVDPSVGDAGGVYWPPNQRAYLWRQPSVSFTRHLFVHELVHQFQFLAVARNRGACPSWYTEGLAEHFAFHTWDGQVYRPGLHDVVGLERNVPNMAAAAREGRLDLLAVLEGRLGGPKPESWAAVHWLLAGAGDAVRERFREQERAMWHGRPFDLRAVLGTESELEQALAQGRAFLGGLQTTWKIEWIEWDTRGEVLVGRSGVVSLIRRDDLEARGGLATEFRANGRAGVLLGFRSTAAFLLVYFDPSGSVMLTERVDGAWKRRASAKVRARGQWDVAVKTDATGLVRVEVDGHPALLHRVEPELLAGPPGLFSDACAAEFEAVRFLPW
jgi:hypothetical protein